MPVTPVAVVRCESYDAARVDAAVSEALALLPEMTKAIAAPGTRVLLKVDTDWMRKPEEATVTHPAVIRALAGALRSRGAEVTVGDGGSSSAWPVWHRARHIVLDKLKGKLKGRPFREISAVYERLMSTKILLDLTRVHVPETNSPLVTPEELGLGSDAAVYEECGIREAAEAAGAVLRYFETGEFVETLSPTGRFLTWLPLARAVLEAGRVISVPKLHVHRDGQMSGAISNMFGIVPTAVREPFRTTASLAGMTAEMFADVFSAVRPAPFAVSDAVVGRWDEQGPRPVGVIVASCDCVAHDMVLAALAGANASPAQAAHRLGLGQGRMESIEVRGVSVDEVRGGPAGAGGRA